MRSDHMPLLLIRLSYLIQIPALRLASTFFHVFARPLISLAPLLLITQA
jgi:hypothetical protein